MKIRVNADHIVSAILNVPEGATVVYVMAHGAGAGMTHPFMASAADGFAERRIATLRYQFPFMEAGSKRPDRPALAQATVRAAVKAAAQAAPSLSLFAGGKSFGGRMTSQAQASEPMPGVCGLVFFGFPLHPAKKPSVERAAHLDDVAIPMLFLQGTRDGLAELPLLASTVERLGSQTTLAAVDGADHAFHVSARSGRTDAEVLASMLDTVASWIAER